MHYWLVKQEPEKYPWAQFVKDKGTYWDGVRNYQARNNLRAMKKGDLVLYYHSVSEKAVVGIAVVTTESYRDPTAKDEDWSVVDLKPLKVITEPVTLDQIKADPKLSQVALIKQSRLSVMSLRAGEFKRILLLGKTKI
ncbi:MAG: EVE domain-containing protein [Verrucomicrobiota bacterium]|jgi:predicted RNA-binding protein with PUA-like domain|nr:EVE domain-containing protein [Verrucomicrobiota bacterium]